LDYINRDLSEKGHGLKEFKIIQKTINSLLVLVVGKKEGGRKNYKYNPLQISRLCRVPAFGGTFPANSRGILTREIIWAMTVSHQRLCLSSG